MAEAHEAAGRFAVRAIVAQLEADALTSSRIETLDALQAVPAGGDWEAARQEIVGALRPHLPPDKGQPELFADFDQADMAKHEDALNRRAIFSMGSKSAFWHSLWLPRSAKARSVTPRPPG